jgi:hypothetical protein
VCTFCNVPVDPLCTVLTMRMLLLQIRHTPKDALVELEGFIRSVWSAGSVRLVGVSRVSRASMVSKMSVPS